MAEDQDKTQDKVVQPFVIDYEEFSTSAMKSKRRRARLFLKRPNGASVPDNCQWKCTCGNINGLIDEMEQHCIKCGTRLRIQENHDESIRHWTMVKVTYFGMDNGAS